MSKLAFLRYSFIFDATDTWQHLYEFEKSLADFFTAHGFEAEFPVVVGNDRAEKERIVILRRMIDLLERGEVVKPFKSATLKETLNVLRKHKQTSQEKAFKKGKKVIRKGYLKR